MVILRKMADSDVTYLLIVVSYVYTLAFLPSVLICE